MPVSTAQVITEEESEECDYDYGDYGSGDAAIDEDDTATTVSLGAVVSCKDFETVHKYLEIVT